MHEIGTAPLSPSRVSAFDNCQLAFRYKYVDCLPERPSAAALRGNLVHSCLEHLFMHPREERSVEVALGMLDAALDELLAAAPERAVAVDTELQWPHREGDTPSATSMEAFKAEAAELIHRYFRLERPGDVDVVELERYTRAQLPDGPVVHGYIDRLERDSAGELVVSDYKTGKAPGPRYRDKAWSQLLTYALLLQQGGERVVRLQLHYLGGDTPTTLQSEVSADDLAALSHQLRYTAKRIQTCAETGDFRARKSPLCNFCSFQEFCPEQGGRLLPWPVQAS